MRGLNVGCGLLFLSAVVAAQTPNAQAPSPLPTTRPSPPPEGSLAQLMRGIMFPNSNIIFNVQEYDPAAPQGIYEVGTAPFSWTEWGARIYTGWDLVENAATVLGEAPDLIMKRGRLCTNGKPAPVERADFAKFAQGLRDAAGVARKAAREKNQQKVIEATDQLAEACVNCHSVYRNAPPGGERRCVP